MEVMVSRSLSDDSFYYFMVAQNLVAGNGSSFDGTTPTNGYHPLSMLIVVLIYMMVAGRRGPELPIHLTLTVGAFLDTATAFVVGRILNPRAGGLGGLLGTALYALNPVIVRPRAISPSASL